MPDRPPFGFGPPSRPGDDDPKPGGPGPGGGDPLGGMFGGAGGAGHLADALRQFADMLSYTGGPVNWDLAKNFARHAIAAHGDPSVLENERAAVTDALRLADLWLDDVTTFPSRSEEHTSELQSHHDLVCRLLLEKTKITVLTSAYLEETHTHNTPQLD